MASPQRALVVMPDAMLGIAALGPYAVLDGIGEGGPAFARGVAGCELRRGLAVAKERTR
jgi:hypothetical protein